MSYFAYLHCKPDGTPFYVGKGGRRRSKTLKRKNQFHQNILNKYGKENILVIRIKCPTEETAFELEKSLIQYLRSFGHKLANMTSGGEGSSGWKAPQAYRLAKSVSNTGEGNPFYGKTHSPEVRKVYSENCKQQWQDESFREKMGALAKQRIGGRNPFFGKSHSEETRRRISESKKGCSGSIWGEEQRRAASERVSGKNHHFFGKTLSDQHRMKLSKAAKQQAVGGRFMYDLDGKRRRVVAKNLDQRISEGWVFVTQA